MEGSWEFVYWGGGAGVDLGDVQPSVPLCVWSLGVCTRLFVCLWECVLMNVGKFILAQGSVFIALV